MITVTSAPGGKAGLSNANGRAQSGSGDRTSVGEDGKVLDVNGGVMVTQQYECQCNVHLEMVIMVSSLSCNSPE